MWDRAIEQPEYAGTHLSHDRPCPRCGHAMHTVLPCRAGCDCGAVSLPGRLLAA